MTDIKLGAGYDDSKSSLLVVTDGGSGLSVSGGDRRDRATQDVEVRHAAGSAASSPGNVPTKRSATRNTPTKAAEASEGSRVWVTGSFIVIAACVLIAVYSVVAKAVSPIALPLVIAAALVCTFLVALFVVPKANQGAVVGFQKTLAGFLRLLKLGGNKK
jgi:Flp pilus assembly protein TadB